MTTSESDAPPPRPDKGVSLDEAEAALGHAFTDRSFLVAALTHRSFANEANPSPGDNESLEFLGDSILSFDVADRIYRRFPGLDEGRLSKHKHELVRQSTLAAAARRLDVGRWLRLGRGERLCGGENDRILANALEALIAAIYLDGGLVAARDFIERCLADALEQLDAQNPISDYKSTLQELTQARGLGTPIYRVVEETGPDHRKRFHVQVIVSGDDVASGSGATKRGAHQVAARLALETLRSDS